MGNLIESGSSVLNIAGGKDIKLGPHVSIQVLKATAIQDGYVAKEDFALIKKTVGVVATQFDKTDATLANITGLTATLTAGKTYLFRAILHIVPDTTGGHKYAISGTATATTIVYQVNSLNNSTNLNVINSRKTALDGAIGAAGGTADYTEIVGTIIVNAGGTLTVQFAQNTANGTSSVLVGSVFTVEQIA